MLEHNAEGNSEYNNAKNFEHTYIANYLSHRTHERCTSWLMLATLHVWCKGTVAKGIGVASKSWLGAIGAELLCYFTISIVTHSNKHIS